MNNNYINSPQLEEDLKKVKFETETETDKLEQAMQNKDFATNLSDTSFGQISFYGKDDDGYYSVGSEINTDGDFAITFFKNYERLKEWFDEWQGEGFYKYLVQLFEEKETMSV